MSENFLVGEFTYKNTKFPAKIPILGIIMDKIEILSIHNLLRWKFAAVKILNTENCNFLPHHFLTNDAAVCNGEERRPMIGDWRSRSLLYYYIVELQSVKCPAVLHVVHADKSLMYAFRFVLHASCTLLIHICKCRVCCDFFAGLLYNDGQ